MNNGLTKEFLIAAKIISSNGRAPRRVGSYLTAIHWIALNDDTKWLDNMDKGEPGWSPSVTLCLVADVFQRSLEVATDDLRRAISHYRTIDAKTKEMQERLEQTRAYCRSVISRVDAGAA